MADDAKDEPRKRFALTPAWVVTFVFCGLAIYVVVRHGERLTELDVSKGKVVLAGGALGGSPEQAGELAKIADAVRNGERAPRIDVPDVSPSTATEINAAAGGDIGLPVPRQTAEEPRERPRAKVDLRGVWRDVNSTATYAISAGPSGYLVAETSAVNGVPMTTATGRGSFDGRTLQINYNTLLGSYGVATLKLAGDGSLRGEAADMVTGVRTPLRLVR